jgi:predicted nucleotidyltransferase
MKTNIFTKADVLQRIQRFDQQLEQRFTLRALKGKMVSQMVDCMCEDEVGCAVIEPVHY